MKLHDPFFLIFLLIVPARTVFSQKPLAQYNSWSFSAGQTISFPIIGQYYDINVVKGSDYYWDYNVTTSRSAGFFAEASRIKQIPFATSITGFISYGANYRSATAAINYEGWEGGSISGVFSEGNGIKKWKDHYLTFFCSIAQQFTVGKSKTYFFHSLGANAGFDLYRQETREFHGTTQLSAGGILKDNIGYSDAGFNSKFYTPNMRLSYRFGVALKLNENSILVPFAETSLLYLNALFAPSSKFHAPLEWEKDYFKQVIFGVTVMRSAK